jgi:hypothetical protein
MGYEEQKISIKIEDIFVEASYNGPRLESVDEITPAWIQTVMDW